MEKLAAMMIVRRTLATLKTHLSKILAASAVTCVLALGVLFLWGTHQISEQFGHSIVHEDKISGLIVALGVVIWTLIVGAIWSSLTFHAAQKKSISFKALLPPVTTWKASALYWLSAAAVLSFALWIGALPQTLSHPDAMFMFGISQDSWLLGWSGTVATAVIAASLAGGFVYNFAMAPYLIMDGYSSSFKAMRVSFHMMKGSRLRLFLADAISYVIIWVTTNAALLSFMVFLSNLDNFSEASFWVFFALMWLSLVAMNLTPLVVSFLNRGVLYAHLRKQIAETLSVDE